MGKGGLYVNEKGNRVCRGLEDEPFGVIRVSAFKILRQGCTGKSKAATSPLNLRMAR